MALRNTAKEVDVNEFWMSTFEEHGSSVMAFLVSRSGHRDDAEDLLQETFIRAMRARPTLPEPKGVRSYLFKTAHHLLLSGYRKKRTLLFSEVADEEARPLEEIADVDATSPESAAELAGFQERLEGILRTLTPAFRTAFEQAVLQQRAYGEIAREQGWSLGQVKTNVHRARKKVIAALGDLLGPRTEYRS
jgi:RNA polymerase sigma-70 factor (ECF subfamily)